MIKIEKISMRAAVLILVLVSSCESKAGTGAVVGGGVGVGVGALATHSAGGALIGGAIGATTGAIIGASLDASDRDNIQNSSPKTMRRIDRGEQLSIDDIKKMSKAGISDDKIIGTIQSTGSVYHLSESDVESLKNAGVSNRVIDYMLQTAYQ